MVVFPGKLPVHITASYQYTQQKAMLQLILERTESNRKKDLIGRKADIQNIKIKTKGKEIELYIFRKLDKNRNLCFLVIGSTKGGKGISCSLHTF